MPSCRLRPSVASKLVDLPQSRTVHKAGQNPGIPILLSLSSVVKVTHQQQGCAISGSADGLADMAGRTLLPWKCVFSRVKDLIGGHTR